MKTAIYIQDGSTQLVLTPESDWEKEVIRQVETGTNTLQIYRGSFYECRGGWVKQSPGDDSLILRTGIKVVEP